MHRSALEPVQQFRFVAIDGQNEPLLRRVVNDRRRKGSGAKGLPGTHCTGGVGGGGAELCNSTDGAQCTHNLVREEGSTITRIKGEINCDGNIQVRVTK